MFREDGSSSRTPSLHQERMWYWSRVIKCKLHHRATSRAEAAKKKLRRRTSQLETAVGSERGRR
eukprot:785366-Prymnesium_polylepis.1